MTEATNKLELLGALVAMSTGGDKEAAAGPELLALVNAAAYEVYARPELRAQQYDLWLRVGEPDISFDPTSIAGG